MSSPRTTIHLGTATTAQEHLEEIFQLYYETFSKPPYQWPKGEETAFRQRLPRLAADPTFGIATASRPQPPNQPGQRRRSAHWSSI